MGIRKCSKLAHILAGIVTMIVVLVACTTTGSGINENRKNQENPDVEKTISIKSRFVTDKAEELRNAIFTFVNRQRHLYGKPPLKWDDRLAKIAVEHSIDMVENYYISHTNKNGEDATARAERHDYSTRKTTRSGITSLGIGENLGKVKSGDIEGIGYVPDDVDTLARITVEQWVRSPGHRRNILSGNFTKAGIGVAYDGEYYLITLNFW